MRKLVIMTISLLIIITLMSIVITDDNEFINFNTVEDEIVLIDDDKIDTLLKKSNTEIPIYENLIPQGLVIVDDYIFISVYDNFGLINSKVYVIDHDGNIINVITLDTNSHVGGLAYDKRNKLLWIPDNDGALNAYNIKDFYKKSHTYYRYHFTNLSNDLIDFRDEDNRSIDYITIVDDNLFIGNFSLDNKGIVKRYKIKSSNKVELEFIESTEVLDKVQGITFYNNYLLLSTSYGRKKPSYLYIYDYNKDMEMINTIKLPSMMEQIYVYEDKAYLIFENTAKKYHDSIDKIGFIGVIDIKDLIKE